jgi:5-methyltetrahydrofolate--homocysteine methyltransferase
LSSLLEKIEKSFAEIEPMDQVKRNVETALAENIPALEIMRSMRNGLAEAGRKYEQGEFFLSELIMGGLLAQEVANILKPHLLSSDNHPLCKVVICTVKGDVHDLGKNLVSMMLSSAGFQIIDLGVDVPSEKFVETVRKEEPTIAAMSCLLTSAMDEMKNTMSLMVETELRRNVKILVGGRPVTLNYSKEIGADGYGEDAIDALNIAKSLINDKDV